MKQTLPANRTGISLSVRVNEKIASIKKVEQDIPAVIIVHNLRDATVLYMSPRGLKILGVSLEEIVEMGQDYHAHFFNADDAKDYVPKILGLLERNNDDEVISFFQQVKHAKSNEWVWYLSCTRIFMRDDEGLPMLTITNATPVDAQHHIAAKAERLLEENNFLRQHHQLFDSLSKREKEILRLMAMGNSSVEIAKELYISEMTASTHRRNIKRKLNAESNYDITRFAQAFDLI
ncbi:MAG TPA: LuxR C-terminal-related transcriptional regulator [Chitinophagaceae bacterium]